MRQRQANIIIVYHAADTARHTTAPVEMCKSRCTMPLTDALFILFIVAFVAAAIFLWVREHFHKP